MNRSHSRAFVAIVLLSAVTEAQTRAQERPNSPAGTVTLPVSDYDRLVDRAAKPPKGAEAPPVDAIVSRAEMKLRVADDFVRGTFRLEGEVFKKGAARVPLVVGATLLETSLQSATPPLALENGRHSAILVGPRSFEIDLGWGAPVVTEPGRASVQIPVPLAGSVAMTIDLPGDVSDVRVEPGLVTKRTSNAGRTIVEASPDRANTVRVSWSARATSATAPRESRFLADIKSLITVDETDLRMAALVDINVVQGQPERFVVTIPAGWTLTSATGGTLESFSLPNQTAVLNMRETQRRAHQVLLGFERPVAGLRFPFEVGLVTIAGAQRETGEVAIEGVGTLELNADEKGAVKRMDTKETHAALRALAREPLVAAFRYHARAGESVSVPIDVKRFPETTTLAAIADRAEATSLVTAEGRVLTEVKLTVRNHAQPFLRVALPAGATILSAEVGGEGVKPAMGEGGTRIPLLRSGFRPSGPYEVSFVYLQTADAFAKRGDGQLTLPRMDVPVGLFAWEVFLPDQLQVRDFGGNVAKEELWPDAPYSRAQLGSYITGTMGGTLGGVVAFSPGLAAAAPRADFGNGGVGSLSGVVTDESGAPIPGASVTITADGYARSTTSSSDGSYAFNDLPNRASQLRATLPGFATFSAQLSASSGARSLNAVLRVATMQEQVTVTAEPVAIDKVARAAESRNVAQSANVANLQRRVAGVLPVRIDIPRAGRSYRFARPLVVDEESLLTFKYKAGK